MRWIKCLWNKNIIFHLNLTNKTKVAFELTQKINKHLDILIRGKTAKIIKEILIFSQQCSFLPSTSLLQSQVNDRAIVHVVISQGVGIFDKNTLKKREKHRALDKCLTITLKVENSLRTSYCNFCFPAGIPVASWILTLMTDTYGEVGIAHLELSHQFYIKATSCVHDKIPGLWVGQWNSEFGRSASIQSCPACWGPEL